MSTLARRYARLAPLSRLTLRAAAARSASPFGVRAVVPGAVSAVSAARRPNQRLYSSQPPPPAPEPNNKPPTEPSKKEGEEGEKATAPPPPDQKVELPEGWVWLQESELSDLRKFYQWLPPAQQGNMNRFLDLVQAQGAPRELQELIAAFKNRKLSLGDARKVFTIAAQMESRLLDLQKEAAERTKAGGAGESQSGAQQTTTTTPPPNAGGPAPGGQQGPTPTPPGGGGPGRRWEWSTDVSTWVILSLLVWLVFPALFSANPSREITWQELRKNFLDKGLVTKLVVEGGRVRVEVDREATAAMYPDSMAANPSLQFFFNIGSVDAFENRLEEAQKELGIPSSERIPVQYSSDEGSVLANVIYAFGPPLMFIGLLWYTSRRVGGGGGVGGALGFGKSRAKKFNHETAVKVKFADVAGMDEAKVEIMEFVSFLKNPEKFQRLGAKIPRGAILSGPPGTGKTLLAKATAGESQVPFFSVSGSEFVEMFVGVGASRVRDLFEQARKSAPCIIFIDEIDAIGKSRADASKFGGGNDEREATLNQILTEMDGFNTAEQVVVLAGTNRPDILDKALLRPGRFDRHIVIDRPTMKGRQDIFKVHLKNIVTNEDIDHLIGRLAALTPGFSGADIANAVNEAALVAARANATSVTMTHFEAAIERVVAGLERKSLVLSPEEKRTVAYHEAGHAICGWFFQYADPLLKVSIIPRGQGALGYAQYLPQGDAYLMNVNQLMDRMAMTLGGRVSEELHFPTVTTGASDDFKKVTRMATTMVTQWGMSEKLGPLHFGTEDSQLHKPFAESTAQTIDAEVRRIVDEAYRRCRDLLTEKKPEVGLVAEELLRKEMLTRDDMVRLLGRRPFPDQGEFTKYFGGEGEKSAPPPFPTENTDSPPEAPAIFRGLDQGGEAKERL